MGLFDQLAKKGLSGLKDKLEKATGVDLDGALNKLVDGAQQSASGRRQEREPSVRASYTSPIKRDDHAYFTSILREAFPMYELRAFAPAAELGFDAQMPAKAYDFALVQGGFCRGVVMLTPHNRDNNMAFKNARAAAESVGIPFINFYTHFPNERDYVIARIRGFLG